MKSPKLSFRCVATLWAAFILTTTSSYGQETTDEPFDPDAGVSLRLPFHLSENLSFAAVTQAPQASHGGASATELNKELSNPVSSLWSISNQFDNFELNNGHWNNNWNFQPVLPISLTKDWNLITRPVIAFLQHCPAPDGLR